jgi:hypothetical protein
VLRLTPTQQTSFLIVLDLTITFVPRYGLGKESAFAGSPVGGNFTRFSKSMVMIELALEMYIGGYDMAVYWDNGDGANISDSTSGGGVGDHMLLDTVASYRMNPMHFGLCARPPCP